MLSENAIRHSQLRISGCVIDIQIANFNYMSRLFSVLPTSSGKF